MTAMNQTFSLYRFLKYGKLYTVVNRNRLIYMAGSILVGCLFLCILPFIETYTSSRNSTLFDRAWGTEISLFFLFSSLLVMPMAGSEFYRALSGKSDRTTLLTLPASDFEKFAVWFIIYVPCFFIFLISSFFFADAVRVWIFRTYAVPGVCIEYIPVKYFFTLDFCRKDISWSDVFDLSRNIGLMIFTLFTGFALVNQAIFTLGSVVWTKNSFLKTLLAVTVIGTFCSLCFYFGCKLLISSDTFYAHAEWMDSVNAVFLVAIILILVFSAFFYWLSYKRFKEIEIINRW